MLCDTMPNGPSKPYENNRVKKKGKKVFVVFPSPPPPPPPLPSPPPHQAKDGAQLLSAEN